MPLRPDGALTAPPPLSLYIHIPWCVRKCPYCDFNSHQQPAQLPLRQYVDALMAEFEATLARHGIRAECQWRLSGEPFYCDEGVLRRAAREAIEVRCGLTPEENTKGGTSDARFVAPLGAECVELGPGNASIHKIDEGVRLEELEALPALFVEVIERVWAGLARQA